MILDIIKIIIWPLTILVTVLILRKSIGELIPTLKRLKYKNLELEFEKKAIEIAAKVEQNYPIIDTDEGHVEKHKKTKVDYSLSVSDKPAFYRERLSPLDMIKESWKEIEKGLVDVAKKHGIDIETKKTAYLIGQALKNAGILNQDKLSIISEMGMLKTAIIYSRKVDIGEEVAEQFWNSANKIIEDLKTTQIGNISN